MRSVGDPQPRPEVQEDWNHLTFFSAPRRLKIENRKGRSSTVSSSRSDETRRCSMARQTILVCDDCGEEIDAGKGASMRINYDDARRPSKAADLCATCAGKMPGQAVARRGRRPSKEAA